MCTYEHLGKFISKNKLKLVFFRNLNDISRYINVSIPWFANVLTEKCMNIIIIIIIACSLFLSNLVCFQIQPYGFYVWIISHVDLNDYVQLSMADFIGLSFRFIRLDSISPSDYKYSFRIA